MCLQNNNTSRPNPLLACGHLAPCFFLTARTLIGQRNTHTLVTLNFSAVFAPLDQSLFERVLRNKLHVGLLRPLLPEKTNNYVLQLTPMPAR